MSKKKILIIDDEPHLVSPVLDRLEFLYGEESYIYVQYFDQGLKALQSENISCLSLDLIMPPNPLLKYKESLIIGINALKQIRENYPQLPIVCFTVVKEADTIQLINKYKAEYLSKQDDASFYQLFNFFKQNQH